MNLAADIVVMLQDFGVPVAAGLTTTKGIVDAADQEVLASGTQGALIGRAVILYIRTGSLTVANGTSLTIEGKPYVAREVYQLEDGMVTRVLCSKA